MTHPGGKCCDALTRLGDRCSKAASSRSLEEALEYLGSAFEHVRRVQECRRPAPSSPTEGALHERRPKARA